MKILLFIVISLASWSVFAAPNHWQDTTTVDFTEQSNHRKLALVSSAHVLTFTGTLLLLDYMWYRDFPRESFHFHNDMKDWKQMDKLGHITSTFHISKLSFRSFRWAGLQNNSAAYWGSISGIMFLTTIEILDGFSKEWGFSWPDMAANALGSASFVSQQIFWEEQKITWKYSYSQTGIEKHRPDLLGNSLGENLVKDYNGHTFWLSFNFHSLLKLSDGFPKWLNLAIGHGAYGMLGSYENPEFYNHTPLPQLQRYRQWYIAPDIDFSRINTGSPFFDQLLGTLNFLKMPSPALEYNAKDKWKIHWVFF